MPTVTIFKESFVHSLRGSVRANLKKYGDDDSWASDVAVKSQREIETTLELKEPFELLEPVNGDLKDIENAIRVHKALPHLTPLQARDPRLWTRLTHVEAWPYMRKRWPVERHIKDEGKAARFIESRYFVAQAQSRALLRNGVARLWWTAKVSHDPARDNPYELAAVLLSTLDITQQILERGIGRAPAVLMGFLEFLNHNKELLLIGGDENRVPHPPACNISKYAWRRLHFGFFKPTPNHGIAGNRTGENTGKRKLQPNPSLAAVMDVFSRRERSRIMSRIRSQGNAGTELRLIKLFRSNKIVGWRRNRKLFGKPDFVFPKKRLVVFVDGCFWHGCPRCYRRPRSNQKYWDAKIIRNKKRDRKVKNVLQKLGWRVVRIWAHELKNPKCCHRKFLRVSASLR